MAGAVVSCPPATSPIFRPPRVSDSERQPSLERLANGWLITLLSVAFACMRQKTANSGHSSVRLPGAALGAQEQARPTGDRESAMDGTRMG
jgi:hypothetical protein